MHFDLSGVMHFKMERGPEYDDAAVVRPDEWAAFAKDHLGETWSLTIRMNDYRVYKFPAVVIESGGFSATDSYPVDLPWEAL